MSLYGMEEDLAIEIKEYLEDNIITDSSDLLELESIDSQMLKSWDENIDDMRIDINTATVEVLKKIKELVQNWQKIFLIIEKNDNF